MVTIISIMKTSLSHRTDGRLMTLMPLLLLMPLSTAVLLFPATYVKSQDVVIVRITPPPPNQFSVADLWQVELTNLSRRPMDVYIIGTVEREGAGLILEARSAVIQIMPGLKRLTGNEVQPVRVSYVASRYRDAVLRTGNIPAGEYILCATAFNALDGRQLGRDCLHQSVQPYSPPRLVAPAGDMVIHQPYPVFTWTPLAPMPRDGLVRYQIRVVKLHHGQPPEVALQTNISWFEERHVLQTSYPYPIEARPFEAGTYAWFVEAVDPRTGNLLARSEAGVFEWEPIQVPSVTDRAVIITPHGIPADLFEAIMRPCLENPDPFLPGAVIETQYE